MSDSEARDRKGEGIMCENMKRSNISREGADAHKIHF